MSIASAIILGIIQGVTEFLPISSSAHLVLVPIFLKQNYQGLTFDIALHIGSLLAISIYFFKDWILIIRQAFISPKSQEGKLLWFIILATFPAAIVGYRLKNSAETLFRKPLVIAFALILGAIILWFCDKKTGSKNEINKINLKESFVIGIAQALAIIPGISRSGITIAAGLLMGLKRDTAAKFSFLLAAPIILGAGFLKIKEIRITDLESTFLIGILTSMIAAVFSINFLLKYLSKANLNFFIIYRILLGATIILLAITNSI